ncbi:uncharacterized protein LOC143586238 [Bidens hawaiensis]|uniref:uncharacterized protein LOC143586238 n=1 Tax=Bidens hawaiensis TaxID=980011 RepID=UPI00404AE8DB
MEAQKFTMLNEIDVLKTSPSTLKVRFIRLWSIKDNKNVNEDFLIEMVLMDENENRIQATVYKQDIFRFKRFLKENSTLTISNASNVKDKNKRTMEISDLSGNYVYLTLWDHYASELSKYFCRVKNYTGSDGKEKVYVSNSFGSNVSHFYINDFLFEIEEHKNSLVDLLTDNDVSVRKPIPVKMLSSVDDEFLRATDFLTSLKSIIILGTIKTICPDTEWYYIGCNTCSRKLIMMKVERSMNAKQFKIKIKVQDSNGVVSLTLFDRDAKMVTKKTTKELIDSQNKNNVENGGFPAELDCLLEKIFAFKVDVADFNFKNNVEDYGINKLTDDTNIITELQKRLNGCLRSNSNSVTLGASISEFRSSGSVSIKDVATDTKGMSASSDDKLKRKLVEVFEVEDDASISATKLKSKTTEDMGTTSESCEGATLLTPKVEK